MIGRRPILAAGNSNGDLAMLGFAGGPVLPALRLLVVHDDAAREFDVHRRRGEGPDRRTDARLDSREHEGRVAADLPNAGIERGGRRLMPAASRSASRNSSGLPSAEPWETYLPSD